MSGDLSRAGPNFVDGRGGSSRADGLRFGGVDERLRLRARRTALGGQRAESLTWQSTRMDGYGSVKASACSTNGGQASR